SPALCTDNAAMVAALGLEKLKTAKKTSSPLDLDAYPRFAITKEEPGGERGR
ncbi:MAG: tRNA (adenosine(37)-N6)-threonylcarbamoyltransferase complex transferase subunit TsaD, partial [Candidatus Aminicenantes bacterium]|nr:tRNA (adenosine(37)-N6)-threonylcarbamoyltransferase complex transferase subunit TsaD [Candidatus Aminicenantes bacterium]